MEYDYILNLIMAIIFGIITLFIGKEKAIKGGFFYGFFFGFIGLIIVLCMKEKEQYKSESIVKTNEENKKDKYSNLEKLYELRKNGTLTEEEYNIEKNKIMNS